MRTYINTVLKLMAIMLITSSCIRDDFSDCPPELKSFQVVFTYDTPQGPRSFDPAELKMAYLYIFDKKGDYIKTIPFKNPELYRNYPLDIELPADKYEFIVWFNQSEIFNVASYNSNESLTSPLTHQDILSLNIPSEGYITAVVPLILYGNVENVAITGNGSQVVAIPLEQNTNTVNVTVKGLPQTEHAYFNTITDRNGNETFLNKPAPGKEFSYVAPMSLKTASKSLKSETPDLYSSLRVLKLYKENQPRLILWDETDKRDLYPGKSGLSNDLIKLILDKYPDVDFKTTHVFDITLVYDTDMNVTVDINCWNDQDTDYEIEPD